MSGAETLPGLLVEQASRRPKTVAIRHKRLGIWREVTWSEYAQAVSAVAHALDDEGVRERDRVALFADNDPRWLYADLGVQALGAASVGLYPALTAAEAAAVIRAAGATIVICSDQEQVDKLLEAGDALPTIAKLVVFDLKGLHTPEYADLPIEAFDALLERGRMLGRERPARFAELVAARRPDEVALVALTSGTTGAAGAALLSHGGEVALARLVASRVALTEDDRGYSVLPLAHATARLFDAYAPLVGGSSVGFPESHETVPRDMAEIAPTVIAASPRSLERIRGEIELRLGRARWFKRTMTRWAVRSLAASGKASLEGRSRGAAGAWLADLLVGRFIRDKAGLGHLRYGGIGGAFVAPDLLSWFWALGVPVREQYGQTETGGIVAAQRGVGDLGTAGPPLGAEVEVRVDGDELFVRSPGLLVGTLAGAATLDDGWFRTGDLGRVDEHGRIVLAGRRAEVVVTAAGAELSPAEIESALKASPYIASAMVIAAGRPFVTAVVELNAEAVADWARSVGVPVSTYAALAENEQVSRLIEGEVQAANARLPAELAVLAFRILPQPLDAELTPTGKIRRAVVETMHAEIIGEMYAEHALAARTPTGA
jgi:long-chain acyl-CoA synthetase